MNWFKNWWEKQCIKRIGNKQPMYIAKDAYQAALRLVMKRGVYHYGNDFLTDMNKLSSEIMDELEEIKDD